MPRMLCRRKFDAALLRLHLRSLPRNKIPHRFRCVNDFRCFMPTVKIKTTHRVNLLTAGSPFYLRFNENLHRAPIASPLLRHCFAIASPLLRHSFATASPLLRHSFAIASPLLRHCFATASPLLRHSFAIASPLLSHCFPIAPHCFSVHLTTSPVILDNMGRISHGESVE